MGKRTALYLALVLFAAVLVGCSQHVGNFSGLATGTYRPENVKSSNLIAKDVTGETCKSIFLFIPLGVPKLDEAVSNATAKSGGDFMMNSRVYATSWTMLLYGQNCFKVEGDVYKTNN